MSTSYLTLDRFKALSVMPGVKVDRVEAASPGFTLAKLVARSRWIDSRLAKRYATPFAAPVPEAIEDWLARIVTVEVYLRHGVDQTDKQFEMIKDSAEKAEKEIEEAANARDGAFELPLRADTSASAISKGAPVVYSEKSPTVWSKIQAQRGREERRNGGGTFG